MNISEEGVAVYYCYHQKIPVTLVIKKTDLKQIHSKKAPIAELAHLNAPLKFTSPKRIKLTL